MEKKQINDTFKGVACTAAFRTQLEGNDKRIGTSAQLAVGDRVTLKGFDYVENFGVIGEDEYSKLTPRLKARYTDNGNGTYQADNSFYAVTTSGATSAISFRTLTSYRSYKENFDIKDAFEVSPGRASDIAVALKPYINKSFEVKEVFEWNEGDIVNGRESMFSGRAIAFKPVTEDTDESEA